MIDRPIRATEHCRHYSYERGVGPKCAAGALEQHPNVQPCMPNPAASCDAREDFSDGERATWKAFIAERFERLAAAIGAVPHPIPVNTSGKAACPSCDGGSIIYSRWHRGASISCTTPNCCSAQFNIAANVAWPASPGVQENQL